MIGRKAKISIESDLSSTLFIENLFRILIRIVIYSAIQQFLIEFFFRFSRNNINQNEAVC